MAEDLGRPTHAHVVATVVVLQIGVDALGRAALVVTHVLGRFVAGNALGTRLRLGCRLATAPRVGLDDRHVPERAACFLNLGRIVRAVYQVVEVCEAAGRHQRQRDRYLAVVNGYRGQQAGNGNITVGRIDVQFVADPA